MPRVSLGDLAKRIKNDEAGSRISFAYYSRSGGREPKDVKSAKDFAKQTTVIATHIVDVLIIIEHIVGRKVDCIRVGQTYAPRNRRHKDVDSNNANTVRMDGVKKRWDTTYSKGGFDAIVVVGCFSRADIPPQLRAHGVNQRFLALLYEESVETTLTAFTDNPDMGGGGRAGKTLYAGYLIYVAVKFKDAKKKVKPEK